MTTVPPIADAPALPAAASAAAALWKDHAAELRTALLIRRTEQRLLALFAEGKLFGTVHTCIGQEFAAVAVGRALSPIDTVFSNHRGHGHFLATGGTVAELVAEVMGKATGICLGRGGSQHLQKGRYFSNGIQGGIVPVTAGLALAHKLRGSGGIAVVFIGDGTLGEGGLYETLNIASKWELPLLVVCENNLYAQSTSQAETLAGDICARAAAFGIATRHGGTDDWRGLFADVARSVDDVRRTSRPLFHRIDTFRLMAHSKGDDNRPSDMIRAAWDRDPLALIERALADDPGLSHVAVVYCETTTGVRNPVDAVADVVAAHGRRLLVDAMSAFGALPLTGRDPIDAVAASSNKCLEMARVVGRGLAG